MKYKELETNGEAASQEALEQNLWLQLQQGTGDAVPGMLKKARESWVNELTQAKSAEELWRIKGALESIEILRGRLKTICERGPYKAKKGAAVAEERA